MTTPQPSTELSRRQTLKFGIGFVLVLVVMVFLFFVFAGRMERHSYYQPSNQNPPVPTQPANP